MSKPPQKHQGDESEKKSSPLKPLEAEIDRQIGDLVPQKARDEVVRRITTTVYSEYFSGPIAHPRHLREYEDICPGAADRIISMTEQSMRHKIEMDQKVVQAETSDRTLGMYLGAGCFFLLLILAFASHYLTGSEVVPALFLGSAALGAIGLFVNGRGNGG